MSKQRSTAFPRLVEVDFGTGLRSPLDRTEQYLRPTRKLCLWRILADRPLLPPSLVILILLAGELYLHLGDCRVQPESLNLHKFAGGWRYCLDIHKSDLV